MSALAKRQKQIIDFNNSAEFIKLSAYYSKPSIFSALGVSRHENTHSNFLAWLLSPESNHALGDKPLRKFLETIVLVSSFPHARGKLTPEDVNTLTTGAYTLSDIIVEREYSVPGGRLDIYIKGVLNSKPLIVVIENKVKSTERDSQTERYQSVLQQAMSRPGIYLGIYLTPLNNREYERLRTPQCKAQDFIQLNYQYLADYTIEPCRSLVTEGSIETYLTEYLQALSLPEIRQSKGDIIMAISKEEQELLTQFWETHKELLTAVLPCISGYATLDADEQEILQQASTALENVRQRDLTRYAWECQGASGSNLPKSGLVLDIISHYATTHCGLTLEELKNAFPDKLQGTLGVVASLEDAQPKNYSGHKRFYINKPIELANGLGAVCNYWHYKNIDVFITHAEKHGYKITRLDSAT